MNVRHISPPGRVVLLVLGATSLAWATAALPQSPEEPTRPDAAWSLAQCLEHASLHGPDLRQAELRVKEAQIEVEEARKVFWPSTRVQAGAFAGGFDDDLGTRLFVGLEVDPIVDGYQDFFARELTAIQVDLSRIEVKSRRALLASEVRQAYLLAVGLARAERHLANALEQQTALVEMVGDGEDADLEALHLLQAEQLAQEQETRMHELQAQRRLQELNLKTLIGLAPETPFAVDGEAEVSALLGPSTDDDGDPAGASAAVIQQQLELKLAERLYDVSKLDRLPQPLLRVGYNEGNPEIESGGYIFLGVDVPLLDWGRLQRRRRQLAVEVERQENDLSEEARRQAAYAHRLGLLLEDLVQRSAILTRAVDLARRGLAIQVERFENELGGAVEVLRAHSELSRSQAELEVNEARLAVVICQQRLLREVGVPSGP